MGVPPMKRLLHSLGWALMGIPWRYNSIEDFNAATRAPWYYRLGAWLANI
jgi:hypothetical protein